MRKLTIGAGEAGRKLDRYLLKIFPKAPKSYLFKALRTNKIKVNGRKPLDLNYMLQENDVVSIFFTEEQWEQFAPSKKVSTLPKREIPVLYEDENLVIFDKPVGLLSQKDHTGQPSLNEYGVEIIQEHDGKLTPGFTPGVCNRLDRNTAGAVIMAKNLQSARAIQKIIEDKSLGKYYIAIVEGNVPWMEKNLIGYWKKDEKTNQACIYAQQKPGTSRVECRVENLQSGLKYSVLRIQLLTGKSHQIRVQLAAEGFPIVGDSKYGQGKGTYQMLCAKELVFPACPEPLAYMKGKRIEASYPEHMKKFLSQ